MVNTMFLTQTRIIILIVKPLEIPQWLASEIASDNQIQLQAFTCGLTTKPGGTCLNQLEKGWQASFWRLKTRCFGQMGPVNLGW